VSKSDLMAVPYDVLRAELDQEWEAESAFEPFGRQLPIPEEYRRAFWTWYEAHQDAVMLRKRLLVFPVTVRVRDLRTVFGAVFGVPPVGVDR
jgi:hypothetical protein